MPDETRFVIASTDPDWFAFQREHGARELNFWRPSGAPTATAKGTPWFFRLRGANDIWGVAIFAAYSVMSVRMAWETFGLGNGVATYPAFERRIAGLRADGASSITEIGCAALLDPISFAAPVRYQRMYGPLASADTADSSGSALWSALLEQMRAVPEAPEYSALHLPAGRGAPTFVRPRLGQSAFRTAVLSAYERRCAITGERTLPVFEAAHIRPFAEHESHEVSNGLLLRSDLHALFDAGLVTVNTDLRVRVSPKIRELYENGRDYYALDNREIRLPHGAADKPAFDSLDYHSSLIFRP